MTRPLLILSAVGIIAALAWWLAILSPRWFRQEPVDGGWRDLEACDSV